MLADARLKNRYQVGRLPLAHSGMGEVWRAQDTVLDRAVIIKAVNLAVTDAELVRRFRREALLTARFDHPGVPGVYDLGEHDGQPYLVLQQIEGITLADLTAEQGPLPIAWVCAIGAQVSSVLIAAQQIGLVHRDVKPSNVMLEPSGAVKVLDFGLAVMRDDDRYSRITQTGQSLGTLGYMAPEQIRGDLADHRSDLYGLGGTLFHLLTAEPPFDGATTLTTLRHQLNEPPPRPSQARPETPEALDNLVHALLAERPADRPTSAVDVYDVLAPLVGELPPIPGVINDGVDPVRAYAAIVGQRPAQRVGAGVAVTPADHQLTAEQAAHEAERLYAAGEYRTAARFWRRLAEQHAQQHGNDDPAVFAYRRRIADAHLSLGEPDRALRQLDALLDDRVRTDGARHPDVLALRREIGTLRATRTVTP